MLIKNILELLPYEEPFLFVDALTAIDENGVVGNYTYPKDSFFYKGHFKNNPVTPGVILTETMAQIGVVCLAIFLAQQQIASLKETKIALVSNTVDFFIPVFPGEMVEVISEKIYFRMGKLKCKVRLYNQKKELVCRGTIAGMIARDNKNNEK